MSSIITLDLLDIYMVSSYIEDVKAATATATATATPATVTATVAATKLGDLKMTEHNTPKAFEASATTVSNLLPFTAALAATATEKEKSYTAEEMRAFFTPGVATNRNVRYLVGKVREAYNWLPESEFKDGDKYTQFCFDQIKAMKDSGLTQKQWIVEIQKLAPITQTEPLPEINQSALVFTPTQPFSGLSLVTKATEKREILRGELITQEEDNDRSWQDFSALMDDLHSENQAASEDDELEFALMRKRNAAKWLKRKAILEEDKLLILQGEIRPKSPLGNG